MGDLAVSVSLHGAPVADTVLQVRHAVRIGEAPNASIPFPGADIAVVRVGRDLAVRGRRLADGQGIGVSLGPVRVWMEHTQRARVPHRWREQVDLRFLATVLLVTVSGLWVDTLDGAITARADHGFLAQQVHQLQLRGVIPSLEGSPDHGAGGRTAAVSSTGEDELEARARVLREGPEASSDDARSGVAYYAWYRSAVPDSIHSSSLARERLDENPTDHGAHDLLARAAYDADRYELAAAHFRWLVERGARGMDGGERDLLWRLARTERRLGRHAKELEAYERILELHPDDPWASSGQAMVMARLGRFDEASALIAQASAHAPQLRYLDVYAAVVAAEQGSERQAVELLERVVAERERLAPELQVELRRDIALDPAFASLRTSDRFRVMLARHLGAAAPRLRH
jgi:thioredoxin-like negative regulator of GroEL